MRKKAAGAAGPAGRGGFAGCKKLREEETGIQKQPAYAGKLSSPIQTSLLAPEFHRVSRALAGFHRQ
jgi:hypothetical protein